MSHTMAPSLPYKGPMSGAFDRTAGRTSTRRMDIRRQYGSASTTAVNAVEPERDTDTMKKVFATFMSISFLAMVGISEAQTTAASCPPEVAKAKQMIQQKGSASARTDVQTPQAPRSLAGARGQDVQAPRGQDVQAPRGQDVQAPRGQDVQAPRGQDVQAPRGKDVQAPRGQDVQAPRGQDVQAPRGQDVQAPRGKDVQAPRGQDV